MKRTAKGAKSDRHCQIANEKTAAAVFLYLKWGWQAKKSPFQAGQHLSSMYEGIIFISMSVQHTPCDKKEMSKHCNKIVVVVFPRYLRQPND